MLSPVSRQTAAEACAQVLRKGILSGERPVGARLPPERELARQLGVTRVTVRTALAHLVAEGLVEQVQGRGTTVLDFHRGTGPGLLGDVFALSAGDGVAVARDLLAVRRALARAVLERFALVLPDTAPLEAAVEAFARCIRSPGATVSDIARADLAIVESLLEMLDSTVFSMCFHPVARSLMARPELGAAMFRDPESNLIGWRLLLAWSSRPDVSEIDAIMEILETRDADTLYAMECNR